MRLLIALVGFAVSLPVLVSGQTPSLLARPPECVISAPIKEISKVVVSYPTPRYPSEARRRHITGKGLYHLQVSYETGEVTSVDVLTSAGHRILDDAAVATLKRWKCRSHTVVGLKVPITFSISSKT